MPKLQIIINKLLYMNRTEPMYYLTYEQSLNNADKGNIEEKYRTTNMIDKGDI